MRKLVVGTLAGMAGGWLARATNRRRSAEGPGWVPPAPIPEQLPEPQDEVPPQPEPMADLGHQTARRTPLQPDQRARAVDLALEAAGYEPGALDAEAYDVARRDFAAHRRITADPSA